MSEPNPHLPLASPGLGPNHTRQHRAECAARYFQACLEYSQSLWLQGKPAQAILQLNKAFLANVTDASMVYPALVWFLQHRPSQFFLGNPVRHFQHLATRISGPRSELRSWRAWACFHLARLTLPAKEFPPDQDQITKEQLELPSLPQVIEQLPKLEKEAVSILTTKCKSHRP